MTGKRIVLTAYGSLGDLHPYLAIALGLRACGYDPVVATSAVYRERVSNRAASGSPPSGRTCPIATPRRS